MHNENVARNYPCHQNFILLCEIETDEKGDCIRFWSGSGNSAISVHAQSKKWPKKQENVCHSI